MPSGGNAPLELEWLPGRYAACRLEPGEAVPSWAALDGEHALLSITRTDRELSIVIEEGRVPADVNRQGGFAAMRIVGTLDFSLTGIIARLTAPLAAAGIPVFVISTYETDVVMVALHQRQSAEVALQKIVRFQVPGI